MAKTGKILKHFSSLLLMFLFLENINAIAPDTISIATPVQENTTPDSEVEKAHALLEEVKTAERFINRLDSLYTVDLPVGILQKNGNNEEQYAILISRIKTRNGNSFLTAYMAFTVPGTTKKIAFKGDNIPFSYAGGIKGEATLELVDDFEADLTNEITMILKGHGLTKVAWDCDGFKQMDLTADLLFDPNLFIPENEAGERLEGEKLVTTIQTSFNDWNNMMVGVSLQPFQLKPLTGVGFNITNAVFDMSDFQNPANIQFGENYQDYFIGENHDTWRGVYIQEVEVRMPPEFKKKQQTSTSNRLTFYGENLLIDELGFTGSIGASNLLTLEEGDLGSWNFSVEDFHVDIQSSQLVGAAFNGQIYVPQFEENSVFDYQGSIGVDNTYGFNVGITESMMLDIWAADMTIDPNSTFNILVENGQFKPSLLLNGSMSVKAPVSKDDPGSKSLAMANIPFQGMKIQTVEPYFSVDYISFGTEQNAFSGFPVSVTQIGFVSEGDRMGLNMGLMVNFTGENDGGFGGEGIFTVWGAKSGNDWNYDGVEVDKILVDVSKPGAFTLKGEVLFIRGDQIYGDGFKGSLEASFAKFEMDAMALFGNVDGYRYWFADALVALPAGLPAGPISIHGFGGGAYYRMKQAGIGTASSEIGQSTSGIQYAPDKHSGLGLKASVKFAVSGSEKAFNGDVEFGISFTTNGGINQISFNGNGYFATSDFAVSTEGIMEKASGMVGNEPGEAEIPLDAENAQLYGNVSMLFDFPNKSFHATFNIYANVAGGVIKGSGPGGKAGWGVIHFAPEDWYIHLGTPDNPNGIKVMNLAEMTNYFMAGKSVPELPLPPDEVLNSLSSLGESYETSREGGLGDGSGFALGAGFSFDTGERTFLIFYGRFGCGLGFDIVMKNYGDLACEGRSGPIGINGWYAQGQAWAWVAAAVGIDIDLPFYSGKYEIFELQVAALLQAKAPNPFWMKGQVAGDYNILGGLVKGNCEFEFEIGEKCKVASSSPFGGMAIISEVTPVNNETGVDVFTTPQAVFNMPVGENIEFEDENNKKKLYRVKLKEFTVRDEADTPLEGEFRWNDRKDVLVFKSHRILPGESNLKAKVAVTFEEMINSRWYPVTKDGKVAEEIKEITFTTGEEPDHVPQRNVLYSYPGYRAFNYYQNQNNNNYIKLDFDQDLFNPGPEWNQVARVKPVTGGDPVLCNFRYDAASAQINFNLPGDMSNDKVYTFEIVNLPVADASALDQNVSQKVENIILEDEEYSADIEVTTQQAEEGRDELQEKMIYSMEFRTSTYNSFAEKLNGLSYSQWISWELYPLVHSLTVNVRGERFDRYEVINLRRSNVMIKVDPKLSETDWYTTYMEPKIILSGNNLQKINAKPFEVDSLNNYFFQSSGTRNLSDEEVVQGSTADSYTISGIKHYIAKHTCEYMSYLKGKIANAYVNGTVPDGELKGALEADFIPLLSGDYPVNIIYTLPGKTIPEETIKKVFTY